MNQPTPIEKAARAICKSGKFETGQGTCALLCMEFLGSPRSEPRACPHALRIHGGLAKLVVEAIQS